MHVNPCGRAVDWIQFPFEVDARIHNSAGAPIVRQRWFFTDQPFLPVGTGCVLMNRIWDDDPSEYRVGMLEPGTNNYQQDARWALPANLLPGHICHTEWLATGEPTNDLPPTEYDPNWIPSCCPRVEQLAGGVEIGGEVGDVHHFIWGDTCCDAPLLESGVTYRVDKTLSVFEALVFRYQGAPGLYTFSIHFDTPYDLSSLIHGTSGPGCGVQPISQFLQTYTGDYPISLSDSSVICIAFTDNSNVPVRFTFSLTALPPPVWVDGTEGGAEIGGAAGDVFRGDNATEGGAELGGEVGDVGPPDDPTEGGAELGGEMGDTTPPTDPTEGGAELGGDLGDIASGIDDTEGGAELGGAAGDTASGIDPTEGGEQLGGAAGDVPSGFDPTEGGEQLGGAAGDTNTPFPVSVRGISQGSIASGWTLPTRVSGDTLIAFVGVTSGIPAANAGWNLLTLGTGSPAGNRLAMFERTSNGIDNPPTTAAAGNYIVYAVQGASTFTGPAAKNGPAASATIQTTGFTTTQVRLCLCAWSGSGFAGAQTPPAGFFITGQISSTPILLGGWKVLGTGTYTSFDYGVGNSMSWAGLVVTLW